ncbi:sensor histidine kinase [Clostridium butyricum]|uniref:sensor histidine kinase n=2 Tax=Clostridium butyricum TaxID=1492 RepID=UPI001FABD336|nr:HAMP domain-containing sensor histidine kinase [Clostridium butyricum]MDB2152627.1 HAMP domain-containing sensor histidine kinase [Clostridium butyricum]
MILSRTKGFIDEYISNYLKTFLVLIDIIGFAGISIMTGSSTFCSLKLYLLISCQIIILIDIMLSYVIMKYYLQKKVYKNLILSAFLVYIFVFYIHINFMNCKIMLFLFQLFCILMQFDICHTLYKDIKRYKGLIKEKTKVRKAYIYTLIIGIFQLLFLIINSMINLEMILEILGLFNFLMLFTFSLTSEIEEPGEFFMNILKKENEELDNINNKIILKNKELEKSNYIMKQKEQLSNKIFEFMPHPFIILNCENSRILYVNSKFLELAKIHNIREIINKKIDTYIEFINEDKEKDYNSVLYTDGEKKYLKTKYLMNLIQYDKKIILIEDNTSNVMIKKLKKEVEEKKIQEYTRTQFLSSISHDLKTPINVIYSAIQLEQIYIEKDDIESLKKYNSISSENCISLIRFANNLIDNSKIYSQFLTANLKKVNIVEIVEDYVMSYVDYVSWNGIELIFDTNTEECMIEVDIEFIGRIILNLISNGVKYTAKDGKIYVIIEEKMDKVFIKVSDTGSGINEEIKNKIFNRYESTNKTISDSKSGTGLGLFVVKRLVELQKGKIYLDEKVLLGTSIVIEFEKGETYD